LYFHFHACPLKSRQKKKLLIQAIREKKRQKASIQEAQGTWCNCNDFDFVELESLKECSIWDLGVQFHDDGNLRLAANRICNCEIPDV
jgi:hypothetical protein